MKLLVGAFLILILSTVAEAGVLEGLSQASNAVWHPLKDCSHQYDQEKVSKDLTAAAQCAAKSAQSTSNAGAQQKTLNEIATKVGGDAEDRLFALYGVQHAKELQCAADFTDTLTAKSSEKELGTVVSFVQRLRAARQELTQSVKELMSPGLGAKQCPLSLDGLQPDPGFTSENPDRHYQICQKILRARGAYNQIMTAIPLSDLPLVKKDLERFANMPAGAEADAADKGLSDHLRQMYSGVKSDLSKESQRLLDTSAKGGSDYDRTARYDLISDPKTTEKILADSGNSLDVKALACRADARYGQGADSLDKSIFVGSLVVGFGAGTAVKVGSAALKASESVFAARAAGLISFTSQRIAQTGLVALGAAGNAAAAYPSIVKACSSNSGPEHSVKGNGESCVSAPKITDIEHDNCVLTKSLALMGFTGTAVAGYKLAKEPAAALARKIAGRSNAEAGAASEAAHATDAIDAQGAAQQVAVNAGANASETGERLLAQPSGSGGSDSTKTIGHGGGFTPSNLEEQAAKQVAASAGANASSSGQRVMTAEEIAHARRAPNVDIPSENRPTTFITDSGRLIDANEVKSGGFMPKSAAEVQAHVKSKDFKDGTMTMLVVRDEQGKDHLLYAPRIADGADGETNTHRTLRQLWRDTHGGKDPQVVAAGECIVNMGGVIHSCVNQSGSYYHGNTSADYLGDVATAYGFKKDGQTKIMTYGDNVELGHLKANESVDFNKKINQQHPGLLPEVRQFAQKMYTEHGGEFSGLDKGFARKAITLGRKPDPEWPEDKKKAYELIAGMLPLLRENSVMAVSRLMESAKDEAKVKAVQKYLPDFYRDATAP